MHSLWLHLQFSPVPADFWYCSGTLLSVLLPSDTRSCCSGFQRHHRCSSLITFHLFLPESNDSRHHMHSQSNHYLLLYRYALWQSLPYCQACHIHIDNLSERLFHYAWVLKSFQANYICNLCCRPGTAFLPAFRLHHNCNELSSPAFPRKRFSWLTSAWLHCIHIRSFFHLDKELPFSHPCFPIHIPRFFHMDLWQRQYVLPHP